MLQQREGTISRVILLIVLLISLSPTINSDVISVNSGGTGNIIINPDEFIEGFFFCVPTTCSELDYECDSWSDSCGGTLNCGSCASGFTCTAGSCIADAVTPPAVGAGPGVTTPPALDITVVPTEININMVINTNVERTISVTNDDTSSVTVSISQENLDNMVILSEASLSLAAGETKSFNAIFVAPGNPGVYTGTIKVDGINVVVALNVQTQLLLFDSNIVVLNENYQTPQNQKLKTEVTLIPLGDPQRLDVTLNYAIKDYRGKIYLTKSETLLVEELTRLRRNFDTGILPLGKYVISLELIYPNGVAPSSAHFEVTEPVPTNIFAILVLILIVLILLLLVLIIAILIYRRLKGKGEEEEKKEA